MADIMADLEQGFEGKNTTDIIFDTVEEIYEGFSRVNADNIVNVVAATMELAERQKDMSGTAKKAVVISVVDRVVQALPMEAGAKAALRAAIRMILPNLIDVVVAASRAVFDLNEDGKVSKDEVRRVCCWWKS